MWNFERLPATCWAVLCGTLLVALPGLVSEAQAPAVSHIAAHKPTIRIGAPIQVSADEPYPHVEPSLAVDPLNPQHLLAAAMTFPVAGQGARARVYVSFDDGQRWSATWADSSDETATKSQDDPQVAFGPDGTAYLTHLPDHLHRSTDGGRNWSKAVRFPRGDGKDFDRPWTTVDQTKGPFSGRVYSAVSQFIRVSGQPAFRLALLRSPDSGRTVDAPAAVLPGNLNYQSGGIAVLPDGVLLATFQEIDLRHVFLASPRLWAVRSTDGGETFGIPHLVTEGFRATAPSVAVDAGLGQRHGRVYAAWAGLGTDLANYLGSSDDGGATWAAPVRFASAYADRHMPHVSAAVNRDGVVGLAWLESAPDAAADCFRMLFAVSLDGGHTISSAAPVSAAPACNDTPANRVRFLGGGEATVSSRWVSGGDYHALITLADGRFQVFWAETHDDAFQLWTAPVSVLP